MQTASDLRRQRWVSATILFLGLAAVAMTIATPAAAQLVTAFSKDDCNGWNNLCGRFECDEVRSPALPIIDHRTSASDARVQYVFWIDNDDTVKTGLTLMDVLPPCVQIDCDNLCVDTPPCNDIPDAGPVYVNFDSGGFSDPPLCDPVTNMLTISNINLAPNERMDVRFCGEFQTDGYCCNSAILQDPGSGQSQTATDWILGGNEVCVEVGFVMPFTKDDCGTRTGDDESCDDIGLNGNGERAVNPPPPPTDKRVKWVLRFENVPPSTAGEIRIRDTLPPDQTMICTPLQDPLGQDWGCFEKYIDGVWVDRDLDDGCTFGVGGGIDVREVLALGQVLELRICARLNGGVQLSCNNNATIQPPGMPNQIRATDALDGDGDICIITEPPRIEATKTYSVQGGGDPGPGDTIQYHIEICESSDAGDVIVSTEERLPDNIINPVITGAPPQCQVMTRFIRCLFMNVPSGSCQGNPVVIEYEGELTCDGLSSGDEVCNQATIELRDPPDPQPVYTDDPNKPGDRDPTCFQLALDDLGDSTKSASPRTGVHCGTDVITYTIDVVSSGSADAAAVQMEDVLDANAQFVSGSLTVDGAPQPDPPGGTIGLDLGDVPIGDTVTVQFQVRPIDTGMGNYTLCNQATLQSDDNRICGTTVLTDDPASGFQNDPTCVDIICVEPPEFDPTKEVTDIHGQPVTEASANQELIYTVDWCNDGQGVGTNVEFYDEIDDCLQYVAGSTTLDGNTVSPDPYMAGPPPRVQFVADTNQNPGECHTVVFHVTVRDDPVDCGEGVTVDNIATISSDEGISRDSDNGTPTSFTVVPPSISMRRSSVLDSDVTQPPPCNPDEPRLNDTREIALGPTFPYCIDGDGALTGARALIYYEVAGDCDSTLGVLRVNCAGDGRFDIEIRY